MSQGEQTAIQLGADKEKTERQVFDAFLKTVPNFAGRPLKDRERGADPPDFLCHDLSGKCIGVELTEWINQRQIASGKARQKLEALFRRIIRSDREVPPRNIECLILGLKGKAPAVESEQAEFRRQLFECISQIDARLDASPRPRSLQPVEQFKFPNYPTLSKYVDRIKYWPCRPTERAPGIEWVRFPCKGRFYLPREALEPLTEIIRKKTEKYSTLHGKQALDELYLIVYYSQAVLYSPPYSAPGFGFRDIAREVSQELARDSGPFQKVFLFSLIEKKEKVYEIWPNPII